LGPAKGSKAVRAVHAGEFCGCWDHVSWPS
jgi:hypothetical protein